MPITQDRLAEVAHLGQELLTQVIGLKRLVRALDAPKYVADFNAAAERIEDAQTRKIVQELIVTLLSMHNTVNEMDINPEAFATFAHELAHYKANHKQNARQAAYQRRKRQVFGKGGAVSHAQGAHFGHTEPGDAMTGPTAPIELSQDMLDYLDGKIHALPPMPGRTLAPPGGTFSESTPTQELPSQGANAKSQGANARVEPNAHTPAGAPMGAHTADPLGHALSGKDVI